MTNQIPMPNEARTKVEYNLEQRTTAFGLEVIRFAKRIPVNTVTRPLIQQFVRPGTSIGANYCEADNAESRKDFIHKIGISKKEAKETKYWIHLIVEAAPALRDAARPLWNEAKELNLIFSAITRRSRAA